MDGCDLVGLFFPGRNSDIGYLVVGPNRSHNSRGTLLMLRRMSLLGMVGAGVSISGLLTTASLSLSREVPLGLEEYTIC